MPNKTISLSFTLIFLGVTMAQSITQLTLKSSAFKNNQTIPQAYTCDGKNTSPPLQWMKPPRGTKSFALIVDDPDAPDPKAPKRVFTHWVVYNIPSSTANLEEGASNLSQDIRFGMNDSNHTSWDGPCPPIGKHRYFHKLYALDTSLTFLRAPTKAQVEEAMKGHILGQTELIGFYEKTGQSQ